MPDSLFRLGTGNNNGNGENASAMSSGGLGTGSHSLFIINQSNSAITVPAPVSSDAALTEGGEWPRVLQSGEAYRFVAVATGPAHTLSWAAGTITSTHTYNSVDADNANGIQRPQRVYFQAFT